MLSPTKHSNINVSNNNKKRYMSLFRQRLTYYMFILVSVETMYHMQHVASLKLVVVMVCYKMQQHVMEAYRLQCQISMHIIMLPFTHFVCQIRSTVKHVQCIQNNTMKSNYQSWGYPYGFPLDDTRHIQPTQWRANKTFLHNHILYSTRGNTEGVNTSGFHVTCNIHIIRLNPTCGITNDQCFELVAFGPVAVIGKTVIS